MTEAAASRPRILLVDDVNENLHVLMSVLRDDYAITAATSGDKALDLARQQPHPDLILLDIRMPGMDGFETAANIKRLDQTKDVPIIFLTGTDSDAGYAFRGYATGAADYLTKPFDPWVLRAKVTVFLDLHRKNQQLERMLAHEQAQFDELTQRLHAIETTMSASGLTDMAELRRHIRHMEDLLREMRRGRGL